MRISLLTLSLCLSVACGGSGKTTLDDTGHEETGEPEDTEDTEDTDLPCTWGDAKPGESESLKIQHNGVERSYQIHLPSDFDCSERPMIIGLHGYYGSGKGFEQNTSKMFDRIDEIGMIGLFPDGLTMGDKGWKKNVTSFNDIDSHNSDGPDGATCTDDAYDYDVFDNCPPEESQDACNWGTACSDDEGLVRLLIQKAIDEWSVDPKRIYLTGFSQGGQTTQALAWRLSDLLAAVAPQHGFATNGYTQAPSSPMGLFQVWAGNDRTVDGNDRPSSDGMIYDGAEETALVWAQAQGCAESPSAYSTDYDGNTGWGCVEYTGCNTDAQVVSCAWNGRHTWGNREGSNFALETMLEFFAKHSRP
jgi:poly(3-hydroxybutyrate) depolymerase